MNEKKFPLTFCRPGLLAIVLLTLSGCKMQTSSSELPRNQNLPLFRPHVSSFACNFEAARVPPVDAQADQWFREALALESPERLDEPDHKKIVQLTRMAADRHHWKAMLNLASMYLANRDPAHGVEDALLLVEDGMRLGIPAAYDRMGTYHMNGTGVRADATRAYAFWQKAAEMGSPDALAHLGERLSAGRDGAMSGYWANIPIATKLLECALAQGHGPAAHNLYFLYREPRTASGTVNGDRTIETKARAVKVLHEGVRLGCWDCANSLTIQFDDSSNLTDMLVPNIDKARSARYSILRDEIDFNRHSRFPNIDKVVPLPPAKLPPWNGDADTLLAAARGISLPLATPAKISDAPKPGRDYIDERYALHRTSITTDMAAAPMGGYWRPTAPGASEKVREVFEKIAPGVYGKGETFQTFRKPVGEGYGNISSVVWEYYLTVPSNYGAVNPRAVVGLTRELQRSEAMAAGITDAICPTTGTWQPWVDGDHPLSSNINQSWRQAWLTAGQEFPQLRRDWLIPVETAEVKWYLVDGAAVDLR